MNADLDSYIRDHIDPEPENLRELDRRTNLHLLNGRMCSGHLQGRLLKMLVAMAAPHRVLELGTFSAYASLCIAEGLSDGAELVTIEANDELEDFIRRSLSESPFGHRVRPMFGKALDIMATFTEASFNLIFIDADKRQYPDYYEEALRLLPPGGFIIADNTLWDGHVVEPDHFSDPQTRAIMEFNDRVAADPRVESVIIPLRDGLTIIRKL